jgi:iron complex transport system permease protein
MIKRKLIGLLLMLLVGFIIDIAFGSVPLSLHQLWLSFMGSGDQVTHEIVMNFRLPKAFTAILTGAALSVSGLLMQTLFRNPLAGPDVLGVTSGASLGVALLTLGASVLPFIFLGGWGQVLAAIIGSVVIMLLVILASLRIRGSVSLLIIGLMFGYFTGALVSILQSTANPNTLKLFITWTFGSLSAVGWDYLLIMSLVVFFGLMGAIALQKSLDSLLLGESYARGIGVNIVHTRLFIILITAILSGTATAFTGPIAFVGITMPHLARLLFRTTRHAVLLPASMLCGATVMLFCDVISQLPAQGPLPINSVTALFGAPLIIWIIVKS